MSGSDARPFRSSSSTQLDRKPGPGSPSGLSALLIDVAASIKTISAALTQRRARRPLPRSATTVNTHGEEQKKLDLADQRDLPADTASGTACSRAWCRRKWRASMRFPTHIRAASICSRSIRSMARRTSTSMGRRLDLLGAARTGWRHRPDAGGFPAPGPRTGGGGLRDLRPIDDAVLSVGNGTHGFTLDRESATSC